MSLPPCCTPLILSRIREILTTSPAHPFSNPDSLVLLVVIIWGGFLMIPFLILVCVFFLLDVLQKTQIDAHLVDFGLVTQYPNSV